MKKVFVQYAAYNVWANQRIADCITKLSEEQVNRVLVSSFTSIYATILHLWDAEAIWWQRLKMQEQLEIPGTAFTGTAVELCNNLLKQSKQWKDWTDLATEAAMEHEFIYRNSKKEQFKQPVHEIMMHLFNHQSYHRGQLVTMFRQVGFTEIPNLDYISFVRKK
jgi:uncharacterized damage-inducible protein DinB